MQRYEYGLDGCGDPECCGTYAVMNEDERGDYVRYDEATAALATRDAEIERLRDKAIRFDLDEAGIEMREAIAVELVESRAEIAKLKRQLVWAVRFRPEIVDDDRGPVLWGPLHSEHGVEFDDTDSGLLAAIDEVCP